jgi:hypothetical protein
VADLSVKSLRVVGFGVVELKVRGLSMLGSVGSKRNPAKNAYLNLLHGFGVEWEQVGDCKNRLYHGLFSLL